MSYTDVLVGKQNWSDYVTAQDVSLRFERALQKQTKSLHVGLGQRDYQIAIESGLGALESGLGALSDTISSGIEELSNNFELSISALEEGIDRLHADFNLLMGEVIWKLEVQTKSLVSILETLQAPLDTGAKELRNRALYAYRNGWHEEALKDFLDAERKNYQDFSVHRSIANIYLYHKIDLQKALEYFGKAAKYARPQDQRQAAEAEYFAGIACGLLKNFTEAMDHMEKAIQLNSKLYDAHYTHAGFAAVLGDAGVAVCSLESAIEGDWRYHERARTDSIFQNLSTEIQAFLDNRMVNAKQRAAEAKQQLDRLRRHIDALLPDGQRRVLEIFDRGERNLKDARTYRDYRHFSLVPARVEAEIGRAEREKSDKEREDKLRALKAEQLHRAEQLHTEREHAERIAKEGMRRERRRVGIIKGGAGLLSSLLMAFSAYFIVGFGGCLIRVGSPKWLAPDGSDYALRAWTTEAFYAAVVIAALGIIVEICHALKAIKEPDS